MAIPAQKSPARKTDPASNLIPSVIAAAATRDPYRHEIQNGYDFALDGDHRTRRAKGELADGAANRSRRNQAGAGGKDRLPGDDGGHYISARFNGPSEAFNHFAQDASFNRGEYRALEARWAKAQRDGYRVYVDIVPLYAGASRRPYALDVSWTINGKKNARMLWNSKKGD